MKKIEKLLFTGVLTLLPLGVTIWVLSLLFKFTDFIGKKFSNQVFGFQIPGLGLFLAFLGILLIGLLTQGILGKKMIAWFEQIIVKIPFVSTIYNAAKGITHSFSKKDEDGFSGVVMLTFPCDNAKSIGFITKESLSFDGEKYLSVFIPTTPNPTNGFLILAKEQDVVLLDLSVDEAIRAIISMGSLIPETLLKENTSSKEGASEK